MGLRKICVTAGCVDLAIAHCEDHDAERRAKTAARRSAAGQFDHALAHAARYQLKAWREGRLQFLKRNPLCIDCGELGAVVTAPKTCPWLD
jgi:5-methylcytosine-specific restriction protein A